MRVVPRYRALNQSLPRRLRWTRARIPTRRHIPIPYRPEGRVIERPSARVSLLHLVATAVVVGVVWGVGTLLQSAYAGRIYPHVTIDRVPVGGMTREEALTALRYSETARINAPIYVQVGERSWQVTPAQFGAHYDVAGAVGRALALAHGEPFVIGGWDELQTIWQGANVPLTGWHDPAAISRFLNGVARTVYVPPRRATVGVAADDVAIVRHSVAGSQLDLSRAAVALGAVVNTHSATAVTLPQQPVESALGDPQAEATVARAHALLAAPIQFRWTAEYASRSWLLARDGMLRLLTFTPRCSAGSCRFDMGINVHKLAEAFNRGGVARGVDRAPTPASYKLFPAGNPRYSQVQVLPDFPGDTIDVPGAAAQVLQQANAPAGARTILLPTLKLYTSFTAAAAQALNFNQDVGYSGVRFSGIDWARLDNLNIGANVINDTIVPAGHTFSLSDRAGPLTGSATALYKNGGYMPGQNEVGPGDITGVNSGVDLLATAVLAAAYDAGLPIVQRTHYPYLNAFAPPGLDVMVTYGKKHGPDLSFRNTTDHPILLMTSNDGAGGVGVYIFNSAGYAPAHQRGAYTSVSNAPRIALNPDGSVDTTITRNVATNGHATQDQISSHYTPIDP